MMILAWAAIVVAFAAGFLTGRTYEMDQAKPGINNFRQRRRIALRRESKRHLG